MIGPEVAPAGTVAVTEVSEPNASVDEDVPLNRTSVMPVKPLPVIVTSVPATPHVGLNDVIVDADAGNAVTRTAVRPSASVNAAVRADSFISWNRKEGSPFLALQNDGCHAPLHQRRSWMSFDGDFCLPLPKRRGGQTSSNYPKYRGEEADLKTGNSRR